MADTVANTVPERLQGAPPLALPHPAEPRARGRKVLDWDPVDRCRLLIGITIPFFAAYALRSHYLAGHPQVEPYYDRAALEAMRYGLTLACAFYVAFIAWGSRLRRRPGPHTGYLLVGALSWWLGVVSVAYALGPITTPAWIAVVIGCATHVLLFPRRVAMLGIGAGLTLLLASLVCVGAGWIPYGPALTGIPIVAGTMPLPYLIGNSVSSMLATLAVAAIITYVVTEWRGSMLGLQRANAHLDRVVEERTRELSRRRRAEVALRESEARYRRLTENAFDLILEVDAGGRALYASPNHASVLGWEPGDLEGRVCFDLVHPDERGEIASAFRGLHETHWGSEFEMRIRHKDGSWRWLECSGKSFPVPSGETRAVIISRDVTERRLAQIQQEKLEAQLLQTQKLESLGVLAGGIAHDFRNLLQPILGNARLARAELAPDSPVVPLVDRIATAAVRTSELTDQLLAYAGRGTLSTKPLDLVGLLREMGELLHTAVSRKVELAYELPEQLPLIEGDSAQLRQVVMNLIINASEAIGDGPGVVSVIAGTVAVGPNGMRDAYLGGELVEGPHVYLEVRDDGCGMDETTRRKIFDPFFTTKFTGRGLGLAALLGIVRAHGGAVRVESEPGRGTRFRLLFPVAPGVEARAGAEEVAGPLAWRGSGTVLVGDDEASIREFAAYVLGRCGMSVILAKDGREAVELFRERRSEIVAVLLDVTMPGLGGVEALAEMRRLRPDMRIILSSGYTEADVAARFRAGEIDGFLQKPYEPEVLVRKLSELLDG